MGELFLKLLNMSITASWLILAVLCIRLLFRKIPKWVTCLLWGVVAIRLIFPFSIESHFSLQPSAEPIKSSTIVEGDVVPFVPSIDSNLGIVESTVNPVLAETFAYQETESVAPLQVFTGIAGSVWLCGMLALFIFAAASMIRLRLNVREAVLYKENIYICDAVKSPFILGIVKPRIYLSSALKEEEMNYIIAHEKAHLRRKDHLWKPFGYLLLCIYWFNPLCWIAYIMLCKDIELACDEKVVKDMSFGDKKEYSRVLLSCAMQRRLVSVCPLAFGEVGVKERVKSVLNYKRPAFWITMIAVVVCVIVAICFLTNPKEEEDTEQVSGPEETSESVVVEDSVIGEIPPDAEQESVPGTDSNTMTVPIYQENIDAILENADTNAREGYVEATLTYVDSEEVGWDYHSDNPWETDAKRDELAQAALKELYTLTGYNVEECTYTTDGRSRFIFGKSGEMIRKSIAFYSRDYGYTLAGDNVPYMGFVNARRFHYSDVQQLDSPYHKEEFAGHGAIPMWFLEHSGVYQGQKIKGFDAINLDDTRYTHISLNFDGGYYLVVMDEAIESVSEVSGPYYDEDTENAGTVEMAGITETTGTAETTERTEQESATGAAYLSHIEDAVYRDLITEMLDTGEFPASDGTPFHGNAYDNSYSIADVDNDGKEELLINFSNAFSMAGMVCYVYDYDRVTEEVYIEHAGFPAMTFYDSGYLKAEASHNHGRSSLDDFWPYDLYVYNAETDKYELVALMDAWQQRISEDVEPDPDFPVEKDLDGDGVVYYDMAENYYAPVMIMDNAEYEKWCEQYNKANTKEIQWYPIITEEEYNERYPSTAVG